MNYKTIYHRIYDKLEKLILNIDKIKTGDHGISKADCIMDLYLDVLSEDKEEQCPTKIISLSHYYEQNGDLVPDPDMIMKIYTQNKMAEALTYQDFFGFQTVYPTPTTFYPDLKIELNSFLNSWLSNCLQEGHRFPYGKETNFEDR